MKDTRKPTVRGAATPFAFGTFLNFWALFSWQFLLVFLGFPLVLLDFLMFWCDFRWCLVLVYHARGGATSDARFGSCPMEPRRAREAVLTAKINVIESDTCQSRWAENRNKREVINPWLVISGIGPLGQYQPSHLRSFAVG